MRRMLFAIVLLGCIASLGTGPIVQAQGLTQPQIQAKVQQLPRWWQPRANQIADVIWNSPCGGNVTRVWADFNDLQTLPEAIRNMRNTNTGQSILPTDAAVTSPLLCMTAYNITFNWKPFGGLNWQRFCTLTAHETGHAANVGHTKDPRKLMYAGIVPDNGNTIILSYMGKQVKARVYDPRCAKRGRPYLLKHGVMPANPAP